MRYSHRATLPALAVVSAAVLTTAGCGGGADHADPPPSAFAAGACQAAAPAVLQVGQVIRQALDRGHPEPADLTALTTAQQRLRDLERSDRWQPLVTAIGLYRLHAVGNTLSSSAARAVASAQHRLVTQCVPSR